MTARPKDVNVIAIVALPGSARAALPARASKRIGVPTMLPTFNRLLKLQLSLGIALMALALATGCEGPPPPPNVVSGTVTLDGKVLNWGTVEFHGPEKQVRKAQIQTDGSYSIRNPELGDIRVVVKAGIPPKGAGGGGPAPAMKLEKIDIPEKYSDPEKTEYRIKVTAGQTTQNIDLKK